MRTRLEKLGIIRESGHEHFNGSIVIPVFDRAGRVVGMYGRKITENLGRARRCICICRVRIGACWNEQALEASKEIILCESLIDALTFWSAGFRNVTASYGVSGFTEDHRAAFGSMACASADRLRPRRSGRQSGGRAAKELMASIGAGACCFRRAGRQRVCAEGHAGIAESGLLLNQAEAGQRKPAAKEETVVVCVEEPRLVAARYRRTGSVFSC